MREEMQCQLCGRLMSRIEWESARYNYQCPGIPGVRCNQTLAAYKPVRRMGDKSMPGEDEGRK